MSIARALSVLGVGLQGYGQGQDQARKQQRDEEDDAWRKKQRERTETQWQRDDAKYSEEEAQRQELKAAAKPVAVQEELAPDQAGPQAYRAGDGPWTGDPTAANDQAGQANTLAGTTRRMGTVLQKQGKLDAATKALGFAKELEQEGVIDALKGIRTAMPTMESIAGTKAGFVSFEIPSAVRENFDAKGKMKIPPGAVGQAYIRKLPDGTQIPDYRLVSPDGTTIHQESGLDAEYALTMTLQQRQAADKDMAGRVQTNAKNEAAARTAAERAALEERRVRVQEGQLSVAERRLGALENRGSGGGAGGGGPAMPESPDGTFDAKLASQLARDNVLNVNKARVDAGQPAMSPREIAKQVDAVVNEMRVAHSDRFALNTAARELTLAAGNPAMYAQVWSKALRVTSPAALQQMGFQPPPSATTKAPPPPGGTTVAPAPAAPPTGMAAAAAPKFTPNPQLDAALMQEQAEMGDGKRMQYSTPELAAYAKAKAKAKANAPYVESEAQRTEREKQQRMRLERGY